MSAAIYPGGDNDPSIRKFAMEDAASTSKDKQPNKGAAHSWELPHASSVQQAYNQLLNRWTWDQFTTNTFRKEPHPERADKLWRVWISMMNRALYGHRWETRGGGLYWCRVTELQRRGVTHFHGLLGGPGAVSLDYRRWEEQWLRLAGIARMEQPISPAAVQRYMVKHLFSGGEIDFGGSLLRESQTLSRTADGPQPTEVGLSQKSVRSKVT